MTAPNVRPRRVYGYVIAAFVLVAGVSLLGVDDDFRTPTLEVALDTFHAHDWGALFIVSAVVFFVFRRRHGAAAPMAFMLTAWSSMIGWAVVFGDGASPVAYLWPACLAVIVTLGIARADL